MKTSSNKWGPPSHHDDQMRCGPAPMVDFIPPIADRGWRLFMEFGNGFYSDEMTRQTVERFCTGRGLLCGNQVQQKAHLSRGFISPHGGSHEGAPLSLDLLARAESQDVARACRALEEHLSGKPISTPVTHPICCNVKWEGKDAHWMPAEACALLEG